MHSFLMQIFQELADGDIYYDNTIIISDPPKKDIEDILDSQELRGIKFIRGGSFDKDSLMKANVMEAKKVFIIADEGITSNQAKTERQSTFEIDSRTVMTVLTVKALNKNVHVTAELLESGFRIYLEKAHCDEILFSEEMHSKILARGIVYEGMINIFDSILGNTMCGGVYIEPLKEKFVGSKYSELKQAEPDTDNIIMLGILENIRNHQMLWNEAIYDAKRKADFVNMALKLRSMKDVRPYNPVLLPSQDYIIPSYSAKILLKRSSK